jgi:endonuclease/exonuclease/phosphatase family metal-dependent hydrolase
MNIDIVSFNLLYPYQNVPKITYMNFEKLIKEKYNKKSIEFIQNYEENKYLEKRMFTILDIINQMYQEDKIICLQEVPTDMLLLLKKYPQILKTNGEDKIKLKNGFVIRDEYRIIIIPQKFNIINYDILQFTNEIAEKDCLAVTLEYNNKPFIIINIHFHWKSNYNDYERYIQQIKEYNYSNLPLLITGDFNSNINSDNVQLIINSLQLDTNNQNYNNNYTSHDIHNKGNYDWYIHFLTKDIQVNIPTTIIESIPMYNIPDILENYLQTNTYDDYISDHKAVSIQITI